MAIGAYRTAVTYRRNAAGGVDYEYLPALPVWARRFVVHDSSARESATVDGVTVAVFLARKILDHVAPGREILGAQWLPDYVWPAPVIPEPVRIEAPQADQVAFVAATLTLKNAVTRAIARHYLTHADIPDDPITRSVEWLSSLTDRAREISG